MHLSMPTFSVLLLSPLYPAVSVPHRRAAPSSRHVLESLSSTTDAMGGENSGGHPLLSSNTRSTLKGSNFAMKMDRETLERNLKKCKLVIIVLAWSNRNKARRDERREFLFIFF